MPRLPFSSLRVRLILLVLIAVIPAFGLIVYTAREERRHAAEDVKLEALRLTQLVSRDVEHFIGDARQMLMALSMTNIVRNRNAAECNKRFAAIIKQNPLRYLNIGVTDEAANLFASAIPPKQPINYRDRVWFQRVVQSRNFVVGESVIGRLAGKPILVVAYPVLDDQGAFLGTVFAGVDLAWLNQMAKEAKLPEGTELTVVDRQGTLLVRYPDPEKWVGKVMPDAAIIKTTLSLKEGVAEVKGLDGIQRLYAFVPIQSAVDTGLYVITGIPKEIAFAEINRQLFRNLAVLGLVAALALAAAWIAGDKLILRRVKALVSATEQLKNGNFSARTGLPHEDGEISQLARTFDQMAESLEQRETERKQAEEALKESEERYRSVAQSASDAIISADDQGKIIQWNQGAQNIFGYAEEEILGKPLTSLMPEQYREAHLLGWQKMQAGGVSRLIGKTVEIKGLKKDGSEFPLELSLSTWKTKEEVFFTGIIRDITERKQAEETLKQSEEKYRTLIDNIQDGVFVVQDGKMQFVNEAFASMTGYTVEEIIGLDFRQLVAPEDLEMVADRYYRRQKGEDVPREYEFHLLHKDGVTKTLVNMNVGLVNYRGRVSSMGTLKDITKRKQAEAALAERERLLQMIFDAEPECVKLLAEDGTLLQINRAGLEMAEAEAPEQVIGGSFYSVVAPEHQQAFRQLTESVFRGEPGTLEYELIGLKGTRRWQDANAVPLRDQKGAIIALLSVTRDTTERKQLEAQLLQAQKLEAVGTLAGGIAHDFNNLLTAGMGNLELAKLKIKKDKTVIPYLEELEKITRRAAELTNRLLAFSRRHILQPVPLNLNDTFSDMNKVLSRILGEHIDIGLKLERKLDLVKADPVQMEQVIMNLCVNARDAMPEGGKLTLATHNIRLEGNYINNHPWVEKGDYVLLEVTDTGSGMDKATLERIFEPFFTTKEVGKGTGLGLSMVYGIIKQHRGYVNVYSEPGQGTTFKIYLPRLKEEVTAGKVKEAPKEVKGGRETILLAEDENSLRETIRNVLEMYGYTVLAARDGQEAVAIYEREREKIELVILDAVMPRMGGMEAADFIYKLKPSQKILFSSGYSAEGLHESFTISEEMHFIQKPYTAKALAQKVREVLEA